MPQSWCMLCYPVQASLTAPSWRNPSQHHPLHRMLYNKGNRPPEDMLDCTWADLQLSAALSSLPSATKSTENLTSPSEKRQGTANRQDKPITPQNSPAGGTRLCESVQHHLHSIRLGLLPSQPFRAGEAVPGLAAHCAITSITHVKQDKQPPCSKPLPPLSSTAAAARG